MNVLELLNRAAPIAEPVYVGEWATLGFRPDLGSQQEFIVGVAAAIRGDNTPHVKWLPSFQRLSALYGEALSGTAARELLQGVEQSIRSSFKARLTTIDTGTPHVRATPCGHMATDNVEKELIVLLKRHAGPVWAESRPHEDPTNDDWAYSLMHRTLTSVKARVFVPHRTISIGTKTFNVGLDNGASYGNIVSARYANFSTIEKHVSNSLLQVLAAHKLSRRNAPAALFVVLPKPDSSVEQMLMRKTQQLLGQIEDVGVSSYSDPEPEKLALELEQWADTDLR